MQFIGASLMELAAVAEELKKLNVPVVTRTHL